MVSEKGVFEGGVISPGIRTSARALWGGASMLPEIEIKKPESILAKETVSSMQGGLCSAISDRQNILSTKSKKLDLQTQRL